VIRIVPYDAEHRQAFLKLYRDYLQHYGIADATPEVETRITDLLAQQRHMSCHIAFSASAPVGFATWGLAFPSDNEISLVMKELFVSPGARGQGVGRRLIAGLLDQAKVNGCVRMDWATDAKNQNSQAFYDGISAPTHEKTSYRIGAADFDRFIDKLAN